MTLRKQPFFPLKIPPQNSISMNDSKTPPPKSRSRRIPTMNLIEKNGKLSQEREIRHRDWYSEVQFRPVDDFGGAQSPPLWKNSPSPARSPSRPLLGHRGYRSLSPDSRAQAIAKGRSELMEMVKHMPETNYELSLKDIVEHHHRVENQSPRNGDGSEGVVVRVKKGESRRIDRNLSFENKGLFLNMAFPFSLKSTKKKKIAGGNSGRVSPKPEGLKAGGERDWWKKKFTGSSDSDSSRTSATSVTSATTVSSGAATADQPERRRNGLIMGCFNCFNSRGRSKSAE